MTLLSNGNYQQVQLHLQFTGFCSISIASGLSVTAVFSAYVYKSVKYFTPHHAYPNACPVLLNLRCPVFLNLRWKYYVVVCSSWFIIFLYVGLNLIEFQSHISASNVPISSTSARVMSTPRHNLLLFAQGRNFACQERIK